MADTSSITPQMLSVAIAGGVGFVVRQVLADLFIPILKSHIDKSSKTRSDASAASILRIDHQEDREVTRIKDLELRCDSYQAKLDIWEERHRILEHEMLRNKMDYQAELYKMEINYRDRKRNFD